MHPKDKKTICKQMQQWLEHIIIKHNFCPFAKREFIRKTIRFQVEYSNTIEACLHNVIDECIYLDENIDTETTLIIFPEAVENFDDFLDLVEIAEVLLVEQGYDGIYQLANFHPDYIFVDSNESDAANYTNRTPYPVLHLLRSASMKESLESYSQPELIPQNNIKLSRELGLKAMQTNLANCIKLDSKK